MDKVVHPTEDGSHCVGTIDAIRGVDEHSDVVVPVQKRERAFPQHNECCVSQFQEFGESENVAPNCDPRNDQSIAEADGVVNAVVVERMENAGKNGKCSEEAKHS